MGRYLLQKFTQLESSSSLLLLVAIVIALLLANSAGLAVYQEFFHTPLILKIGLQTTSVTLTWLINDGLMVLFFLLVSLEIKRELLIGELNNLPNALLPGIAALGGMLVPAFIYYLCNRQHSANLNGWAIPTATDIAFSLGILNLLGKRIPPALKAFLTALAILDDLGAIIIIACFYTQHLALTYLLAAAGCFALLSLFNHYHLSRLAPYLIIGLLLWVCILKSGIHPSIAGVLIGLTIPLQRSNPYQPALLPKLEQQLHPWVAFFILPLFALANSGITLNTMHWYDLINPLPLGIALGLLLGKPIGILSFTCLALRLKLVKLPNKTTWQQFYGVSLLCGIGFTMSLFIANLAFIPSTLQQDNFIKIGVLTGSILSGIAGYLVLRFSKPIAKI